MPAQLIHRVFICIVQRQIAVLGISLQYTLDGSDIMSVSLSLGASTLVSRGVLLNLTTGIGISENAPDYSIGLSASLQTDALRNFIYR